MSKCSTVQFGMKYKQYQDVYINIISHVQELKGPAKWLSQKEEGRRLALIF